MRKSILCVLCTFALIGGTLVEPLATLADGTYTSIGTSDGADGSNDAIDFAQGRVWTIDQYGKYIWLTQARTGPTSHWAFSNDSGATWSQGSESYTFLTRGSVAYDSINDKLHVIWAATDAADGIIYRRYGITRDGSHNITAISREDSGNVNLQLDTSSSRALDEPVALWVNDGSTNGSLLAFWSKQGSSLSEVRGSMRHLSLSAADGVAGNWVALDGTGDTFATDAPLVAADKIYGSTSGNNGSSAIIRGGTGARKNDLYVFVQNESTLFAYRAVWSSGSSNWSGGWQSPVTVGSATNSSGYNLKYQLITKPVLDSTNDKLYIGWSRWKDNTNGDTDSIAYLDSSDTASSTVDVYSALGTHSYAPTLDIAYDSTQDLVYVSYIESTTNGDNGSIDYKTYNGTSLSGSTRFYTSTGGSAGADGGADIPVLFENRQNSRLLFAFRINGALPPTSGDKHTIDWGYITLPTPTPTPTPTTSTSSTTLSVPGAPQCTDPSPTEIPYISSAKNTGLNSIQLFFGSSNNLYTVEYGTSPSAFSFAVAGIQGGNYVVRFLNTLTTYYFRAAAKNGCTIGAWSNVIKAQTSGFSPIGTVQTPIPNFDLGSPLTNIPSPSPTPTPTPTVSPVSKPMETETPSVLQQTLSNPRLMVLIAGSITLLILVIIGILKFL